MKSEKDSRRPQAPANGKSGTQPAPAARTGPWPFTPLEWFALAFGLFLALAIVKFGNPVLLESTITPPTSLDEFWSWPWPTRWGLWVLIPLVAGGVALAIANPSRWPGSRWLWVLPLIWFAWQLVSATQTLDRNLTLTTLWQFGGCLACYFLGAQVLGTERASRLLLIGLLVGFTFCLMRAVQQRVFEFPQQKQFLLESERMGWTNMPPETVIKLKLDRAIITTNGVDVVNPIFLAKFSKGRVHGTLVYPNALAGVVLLLFPAAAALAFTGTRRFRKLTRTSVVVLTLFLGLAAFFWSGSKAGWLIGLALAGFWLFHFKWPAWMKWTTVIVVLVVGLTVFGIRFRSYFAGGATSVGARFDYWRAAAQNTSSHPVVGSGPGTFQRPYARLKAPEAEMARLTHNDYLEQFSDSGLIGGIAYLVWIGLLLVTLGRRTWGSEDPIYFAVFIGLLGWYVQGLTEFSLYVPALAWTAFALAGCLLRLTGGKLPPELAGGTTALLNDRP